MKIEYRPNGPQSGWYEIRHPNGSKLTFAPDGSLVLTARDGVIFKLYDPDKPKP